MIWIVVAAIALLLLGIVGVVAFRPRKKEATGIPKHSLAMVPVLEHADMEQALAQAQTHTMPLLGRHHHGQTAEFPSVTPPGANKHFVDQTTIMPAIPPVPRVASRPRAS